MKAGAIPKKGKIQLTFRWLNSLNLLLLAFDKGQLRWAGDDDDGRVRWSRVMLFIGIRNTG